MEADTNKRSVEYQPSETAIATAFLRALASHDEREEVKGPDYLAEVFLTEDRKHLLKDPILRKWVMKSKIAPGMYEFIIARTAFFDNVVQQALGENIPQIVFLGAGYDTRPYRFKDLIQGTKFSSWILDLRSSAKRRHCIKLMLLYQNKSFLFPLISKQAI